MSQENTESVGGKKSPKFDTLRVITVIAIGATLIILIGVLEYRRQVAAISQPGRVFPDADILPGWTPPKDEGEGPWNPPTPNGDKPQPEGSLWSNSSS